MYYKTITGTAPDYPDFPPDASCTGSDCDKKVITFTSNNNKVHVEDVEYRIPVKFTDTV